MADDTSDKNLGMIDSFIRNQTPYLQGTIVQADQKATFLIGAIVVFLGYLESRKGFVDRALALAQWNGWETVATGCSVAALMFLVIGGCLAALVVCPRHSSKTGPRSASFVWITANLSSPEEFEGEMLRFGHSDIIRMQLHVHHSRCIVCLKKWHWLRGAYRCSAGGVVFFILHLVISLAIGLKLL